MISPPSPLEVAVVVIFRKEGRKGKRLGLPRLGGWLVPGRGAAPRLRPQRGRMQNVINTVKGKALEVAEYLTPVLKVRPRPRVLGSGGAARPKVVVLLL